VPKASYGYEGIRQQIEFSRFRRVGKWRKTKGDAGLHFCHEDVAKYSGQHAYRFDDSGGMELYFFGKHE
jgi:hypothetical protein